MIHLDCIFSEQGLQIEKTAADEVYRITNQK